MADNDQNNDEYKFDELETFEPESTENLEYSAKDYTPPSGAGGGMGSKKNIIRNALIVVGVIVFAMLMYKFISGMFSKKTTPIPPKEAITPAPIAAVTPANQPLQTEIPPQPIPAPTVTQENLALQQKVASIEEAQKNVQTEVSSMNQQVGNVNSNVNELSTQITKLNQLISSLSNQVIKQSEEINVLMERTKPKPVKRIIRPRPISQWPTYYINAVIPGRAWLISTNGSTLTVREGTKIRGYGVVKLIDSMEGRVLTSSGRVIRFSQEDS